MATGMSIHIGLNFVDPGHYQGWDGRLKGCVNDARSMEEIANTQGFTTCLLLNEQATADGVKSAIAGAAHQLKEGDILFLTYSGHGGQVPDPVEVGEEDYDETWVLYDRELLDDELYTLWGAFATGVRILVLSDSCHSGSVAKEFRESALHAGQPATNIPVVRTMEPAIRDQVYEANKDLYEGIKVANPLGDDVEVAASVILISGCQDNQVSLDGPEHGLFTGAVLEVWNGGKFKRSLKTFHKKVQSRISFFQSPNYFKVGQNNKAFERQRPFTI